MLKRIFARTSQSYAPPVGQAAVAGVSPNLEIMDTDALLAEQQRLTQHPALQRWCELTFNGVNHKAVIKALAVLMLYTHTGTRYENPAAMLETTLGPRQDAVATLAAHLCPTSAETLRQNLHPSVAPDPFSPYITDSERMCLAAELYRQDGDALVSAGSPELAAPHYTTGAQVLEQVAGQKPLAAQLYLLGANALKQATEYVAAAHLYLQAAKLELHLLETLNDQTDPREFAMRAAGAFAGAATMFFIGNQPRRAIDANKQAAEAFNCVRMYQPAARLYCHIAKACTQLAKEYKEAGDHTLADAAAVEATDAFGNAASAYFELRQYAEAAPLFLSARKPAWAATCYTRLAIEHQRAGHIAQAAEYYADAARAHAQAGQHDQAQANFWQAAANYRLINRLDEALAAELDGTDEQALATTERMERAEQELQAAQSAADKQAQWQQLVTSFGGPPEPAVIGRIHQFISDHLEALADEGVTVGAYRFQMDDGACYVTLEDFDPNAAKEYCAMVMNRRNADGSPTDEPILTVKFIEGSAAFDLVQTNAKHLILPGPMHAGDMLRGQALLDLLAAQPPAQPMDRGGAAP